ncbi:hypothetical protein AC626_19965 [Pseudoalteromonas rubra]|uniref:Uncharacterized protein n=1 Tax=Pseudoalteromonas rubra TaxID=43658 RepID=A0A0L0EPY2_9GAMM|nr:hypothetical protein AC626_19965 [Pseudoalteromonas rubra]
MHTQLPRVQEPHLNLFAKLFLAIVLTNLAIIAIQLGLTAGSLTSDFATLVERSEESHIAQTRARLLAFINAKAAGKSYATIAACGSN